MEEEGGGPSSTSLSSAGHGASSVCPMRPRPSRRTSRGVATVGGSGRPGRTCSWAKRAPCSMRRRTADPASQASPRPWSPGLRSNHGALGLRDRGRRDWVGPPLHRKDRRPWRLNNLSPGLLLYLRHRPPRRRASLAGSRAGPPSTLRTSDLDDLRATGGARPSTATTTPGAVSRRPPPPPPRRRGATRPPRPRARSPGPVDEAHRGRQRRREAHQFRSLTTD